MSNEPIIAALAQALASDPANIEVRAHLALLLHQDGRQAEAKTEALTVLAERPDHLGALHIAESASRAEGDVLRANAYLRLLEGLDGSTRAGVAPAGRPDRGGGHGDSPDESPDEPAHTGLVPDTASEILAAWEETSGVPDPDLGQLSPPGVTLADVGGLTEVKKRLNQSFLMPMRNPELRATFSKSLRGGLLLWGPPGCGKTFIARAVAGELGASFYEVGLADVLDMYIGSSERNLRSVFETARRNRPCVLFFDELDALGQKRSHLRGAGAMRGVVNQILAELDGASTENEGVFVLAATNHPWDIDSALLRPGRFDRTLLVLPPDREAREAIFALHLQGRPSERIDLGRLAKATEGFSGADVALVCEQATESAMENSMASGFVRPITQSQVLEAAGQVRPSIGEWMETARNYALYSNSSGSYDELNAYLKKRRR
ncbi:MULTISPECIES: AAA family ATPase [unclassified Knoellia]|uniref:AAA family ATPase n=1 Tax=Knoellia altitudinis TaxID=3404795 RepID=UPI00360718A5